jgi:hypothetical protein
MRVCIYHNYLLSDFLQVIYFCTVLLMAFLLEKNTIYNINIIAETGCVLKSLIKYRK